MSLICPTCRATYPDGSEYCPEDESDLLPEEAFANAELNLTPGTMIGEYCIERKLGEGAFGSVYAGIQPLIGKKVAIKLLHKRMSSEPAIVSRFIDEARAVNKIGHRNIIDVFSFGVFNGNQHYFVMEFCEGMTLGQLLQQKKRLTPSEALPILRGIADGLDAAHQAGVTHRDLKPDNIFLVRINDNQYFPKLLDFGVAKLAKEDGAQKTATGIAIGTPRYMSPEQCRGKKVDHRTDIYALGCVAHEMLTGKPVFDADSTVDLLFKHMTEQPPAMSSIVPNLPFELDTPILEMLAKRPQGRPSSAGAAINAFADAIRVVRASKPSIPPPVSANAANTLRTSATDISIVPTNEMLRTIPNEPLLAAMDSASDQDDYIPATRKSLTELDFTPAHTQQIPPDSGNAEISSRPLHSQVPATLASTPIAGPVVDRTPEVKVIGADEIGRTSAPNSSELGPRTASSRQNTMVVAGSFAVLLVLAVIFMRKPEVATTPTTPEATIPSQTTRVLPPEPKTIQLRAAVSPADARILVDGRPVGSASSVIALPREKKEHAVTFERKGYESQTMWVTTDADKQLGPITLVAIAPAPMASLSASASASAKKLAVAAPAKSTTTKTKVNKDLQKPKELGGNP